ncbi:MAG: hypothetical protein HUU15_00460 [Candidatus Brocadiae bacterium]|nr:hypothetical protein [Candidatus Brocadiia bacterium]
MAVLTRVLLAVLALSAGVAADDLAELRKREDALRAEEAGRRLPLAEHCERCKMWKEADAEYRRLVVLAPDNAQVADRAAKAAEKAKVAQSRPAKQDEASYRQGAMTVSREMAKKWWELAQWALERGLRVEAEKTAENAEGLDEVVGAPSPLAKKFWESIYPLGDERRLSIDALNGWRKRCGLKPVEFSARLSAGAQRHSEYLLRNEGHPSTDGLGAHDEDPSLPGYTPEGAHAGKSSDIGQEPPVAAMLGMLGTYYHRIPLLHPDLQRVGIGWAPRPDGQGGWCTIDCMSGHGPRVDSPRIVVYPPDGSRDVQRAFDNELPDPIPPGEDHDCGTCVSLSVFDKGKLENCEMTVKVNGAAVEGYLSHPGAPARKDHGQGRNIVFIPKDPLPAGAKVEVSAKGSLDGKPIAKSWSFTTGQDLSHPR